MTNRQPAVAGQFYCGTSSGLRRQVASYVEDVSDKVDAKAIVAPHAGFVCSGPVAGKVYSRIRNYDTYVIVGPNHSGIGPPVAVSGQRSWNMPMGDVPIDSDLVRSLIARSSIASQDDNAHRLEHSLEVQLPFIQFFNAEFAILPICVGLRSCQEAVQLGEELGDVIASSGKRVLVVASTDMSHYIPHDLAVKKDKLAIDKVLELDASGLCDVVRRNSISMCGVMPATTAVAAANRLGARSAALISYMTSGETCGDKAQVVGYAGIVIA